MKNNTLFYYLLVFFIFFTINAQLLAQDRARYPFFADYFQQQILYSPAFTGMPDQPLFMSAGRFENRFDEQKPLSLAGSVQGLIQSLGMGVGITAQYHKFDDSFTYGSQRLSTNKKLLKLMVASSYPIRIGEFEGFRMGLSIGALHYKSDEVYVQGINPQPSQLYNERFFKLDMDLGLGLQLERFRLGVSLQHLNEPKFRFSNNSQEQRFARAAYFTTAYRLSVTDWLEIEPTAMLNLPAANSSVGIGNPPYVDLGVIFRYPNLAYLAVHYKINDDDAAVANQGFAMPQNLYPVSIGGGIRWSNLQFSGTYIMATEPKFSRFEVGLSLFLPQNDVEEETEE